MPQNQQTAPQGAPQTTSDVPAGFTRLTPLEMNSVHFNSRRTVITPQLLEQMAKTQQPAQA